MAAAAPFLHLSKFLDITNSLPWEIAAFDLYKRKPQIPNLKPQIPNPYSRSPAPIKMLKDFMPRTRISDKYVLGRGKFGVTYLCTDRKTREAFACKSISKKKLRTAVDVEDVHHEVAIMSSLPEHSNIVKLHAAYEDNEAVHLVMELCEGGELFDRTIVC